MGFKLDAFNMKNEMSRGKFDEEGNYIAKATDPHAEHDEWLKGNYSRGAIARAKEAQAKRMEEQEASVGPGGGEEQIGKDLVDCRMKLAAFLQKGESVLEALGRLGKLAKSAKRSNTNTKRADKVFDPTPSTSATQNGNALDSTSSTAQDIARKEVEMISSLSNALMARYGVINIYEETYEEMLRHVKRSQRVSQDWDPARDRARDAQVSSMDVANTFESSRSDSDQFIYKWSASYLSEVEGSHSRSDANSHVSSKEQETFGPFTLKELRSWQQGGYFGAGGERIVLRRAGSDSAANEEQAWKSWSEIVG
ncbi:Uncharacterized protein involved in protein-protein interaction, contains polyproline-binding GYF domain [Ceraceosorus bombacis]|uniref:Uncharacterized protein involved in protein-protein interaction, contains polyproline-binding GYF domain n=1 Tax=Ceraceosorus bombacis TaxID=401625 RepID=A0A0P1BEQ0_9BASI|nr:Uncharacterized protein involved in protein-protein interaction, contains polyproline-binding GYF domain [Ceraceosorus bombacis]